jgi:glycosyltransferase involved in cell wall biosynthesis
MPTTHTSAVRILITIRQGKIGGGESHVMELISHIDKTKFEPIVLSFTEGPMVDALRSWGIRTHVIYTEKAFNFFVWNKVKKLLIDERIALVHAHGTRANSNVSWAARQLKLPLVYTVHGWSFHPDQNFIIQKIRELSEKYLTKRSALTICVSKSNFKDGQEKINLKNGILINYGINLEHFNPLQPFNSLKKELGISNTDTLVGYLVRITIQKDPHTFIQAIAEVVKKTKSVKFLIVGDGDLKKSTIELAKKLKIDNYIIFQDFRQDIPYVLSGIDIYCLPSLWEGLPIGLLEAMAMKKAIVATPVDGTKEAIEDLHSGILVPNQSPLQLADAILSLHADKAMLTKYGENARRTIEDRFEVNRMVKEVENSYNIIISPITKIKKRKIGIEAQRLFREKKHGLEIVALEVIRYLQKIDHENDYVIFVRSDKDRNCIQETKNFKIREIDARSFPEWEQIKLPKAIKEEKIDLLHCTANTAPLFTSVPIILTLHDIIFMEGTELRGNYYQNFGNIYRKLLLPKLSKKVKKIITVSESEKNRIITHLAVNPSKVDVIYNAADDSFRKMTEPEIEPIRRKYKLPKEFILFFGNSAKKKNSLETIKGYIEYGIKNHNAIPLVVGGAFENEIKELLQKIQPPTNLLSKIITIGYIPFNEQPALYNLATLFMYTSKRESFGMPIIESMACGTPVITSNTSSMPEIAGGAAYIINPDDKTSIGDGIKNVLSDKTVNDRLIELGISRAKEFNWGKSVKHILRLYNEMVPSENLKL